VVYDRGFPNPQSEFRNPKSTPTLAISNQVKNQAPLRLTAGDVSSGDHTVEETPVPIPNTAVKLSGPMIVPTSAKVGIARFYSQKPRRLKRVVRGFCVFLKLATHVLDDASAYTLP
jgi:hypothetical protein